MKKGIAFVGLLAFAGNAFCVEFTRFDFSDPVPFSQPLVSPQSIASEVQLIHDSPIAVDGHALFIPAGSTIRFDFNAPIEIFTFAGFIKTGDGNRVSWDATGYNAIGEIIATFASGSSAYINQVAELTSTYANLYSGPEHAPMAYVDIHTTSDFFADTMLVAFWVEGEKTSVPEAVITLFLLALALVVLIIGPLDRRT